MSQIDTFYDEARQLVSRAVFGPFTDMHVNTPIAINGIGFLSNFYSDARDTIPPGTARIQFRVWQTEIDSSSGSNINYPIVSVSAVVLRSIIPGDWDATNYYRDMLWAHSSLVDTPAWRALSTVFDLLTLPSIPNAPDQRENIMAYTMNVTVQLNAET